MLSSAVAGRLMSVMISTAVLAVPQVQTQTQTWSCLAGGIVTCGPATPARLDCLQGGLDWTFYNTNNSPSKLNVADLQRLSRQILQTKKNSNATTAPLALSGDTRHAGRERESKDLEYRRCAVMFCVRYSDWDNITRIIKARVITSQSVPPLVIWNMSAWPTWYDIIVHRTMFRFIEYLAEKGLRKLPCHIIRYLMKTDLTWSYLSFNIQTKLILSFSISKEGTLTVTTSKLECVCLQLFLIILPMNENWW